MFPVATLLLCAVLAGRIVSGEGQIAFHSTRRMTQDIYLYDVRSAKLHNLTRTFLRDERTPAWSPDGDSLLFVARGAEDRSDELFLFTIGAGAARQITPDGSNSYMPDWAPDGTRIAYVTAFNRLTVMPLDSPERAQILTRGYNPHWSGDGLQISYTGTDIAGSAFVGTIHPDGTNTRFLSVGGSNFMDASWSPNGQQFVAVSSRSRDLDLYLLDADCLPECQATARRLTDNLSNDYAPDWSTDGRSIAYTCASAINPLTNICLIDLQTGRTTLLTADIPDAINDSPSWRP